MRFYFTSLIAGIMMAACLLGGARAAPPGDAVAESMYNYIIVHRNGSIVSFRRMENGATLSAIDTVNPKKQLIPYARALFSGALVNGKPKRVLSIGLGAGSFNRLFVDAFPSASLTTVEIDPMVLGLAEGMTGYKQQPSDQVVINDGRRYLKRSSDTFDWIILDAYVRKSQLPPHLTTKEFYSDVKARLSTDGILISNLLGGSSLLSSQLRTIKASFAQAIMYEVPGSGNIIVISANFTTPSLEQAVAGADLTKLPDLTSSNVNFRELKKGWVDLSKISTPRSAVELTDDFAPVEFLDMRP